MWINCFYSWIAYKWFKQLKKVENKSKDYQGAVALINNSNILNRQTFTNVSQVVGDELTGFVNFINQMNRS